jgi:hypothetical protein
VTRRLDIDTDGREGDSEQSQPVAVRQAELEPDDAGWLTRGRLERHIGRGTPEVRAQHLPHRAVADREAISLLATQALESNVFPRR